MMRAFSVHTRIFVFRFFGIPTLKLRYFENLHYRRIVRFEARNETPLKVHVSPASPQNNPLGPVNSNLQITMQEMK